MNDERSDLLATLAKHRFFLRHTARGLTDEQAAQRSTVSALCIGGIVKHVTAAERQWVSFILEGPSAMGGFEEDRMQAYLASHQMLPGETLTGLLDDYSAAATRTEEVVLALPDLGSSHPLPEAPWFEPGARWSARRVLLHLLAETAQHAGHADIIREAIDGAKTMG